jgi:hypothetical protein
VENTKQILQRDNIEQKSKNGVAITTECEGEDYLVTENEENGVCHVLYQHRYWPEEQE